MSLRPATSTKNLPANRIRPRCPARHQGHRSSPDVVPLQSTQWPSRQPSHRTGDSSFREERGADVSSIRANTRPLLRTTGALSLNRATRLQDSLSDEQPRAWRVLARFWLAPHSALIEKEKYDGCAEPSVGWLLRFDQTATPLAPAEARSSVAGSRLRAAQIRRPPLADCATSLGANRLLRRRLGRARRQLQARIGGRYAGHPLDQGSGDDRRMLSRGGGASGGRGPVV